MPPPASRAGRRHACRLAAPALFPMWTEADDGVVSWLLESDEPGLRAAVRRDVLLGPSGETPEDIRRGPWVRRLLADQAADGGFGGHPYAKWAGAHWRLVSLVELGLAGPDEAAVSAARTVVRWLNGEGHLGAMPVIRGRARRHASQEGNALAVCTRLGMAFEPDVAAIADRLVGWEWPDGGWNCDRHPEAHHSSVNESLPPDLGPPRVRGHHRGCPCPRCGPTRSRVSAGPSRLPFAHDGQGHAPAGRRHPLAGVLALRHPAGAPGPVACRLREGRQDCRRTRRPGDQSARQTADGSPTAAGGGGRGARDRARRPSTGDATASGGCCR